MRASSAARRGTVTAPGGFDFSRPEIPSAELPLILERLHRVDRSPARATGNAGIGLAIVRRIIEAHGGEVGARSAYGHTEISFRLPAGA